MLERNSIPSITPTFRFQWEEAQNCYVILYPEGMIKLSQSAGEIMKLCDGERDVQQIIDDLHSSFPKANIKDDVNKFLEIAYEQQWITTK